MSEVAPIHAIERGMRRVRYVRYDGMLHPAKPVENSLLAFVYDAADFEACGVFTPFHLFNQQSMRGGGSGGMGPGAKWEPFAISSAEYRDLADAIRIVPPERLRERARFAWVQYVFDPEFDGEPESYPFYPGYESPAAFSLLPPDVVPYVKWMCAVCAKHRGRNEEALRRAGFLGE
jgi:hypothetical protein